MTNEETISEENALEENLKKRLELELGLPLAPQLGKQVEQSFVMVAVTVELATMTLKNVVIS